MTYYSETKMKDLRVAFDRYVLRWAKVKPAKMFGCPVYEAGGRLFALLVNGGVIVAKLSSAEQEEVLRLKKATLFKSGRKLVRNWLRFSLSEKKDLKQIMPFVKRSHQAALQGEKTL